MHEGRILFQLNNEPEGSEGQAKREGSFRFLILVINARRSRG
jgi:hypothetical protein